MTKRPTSFDRQDLFTSEITRMALESITNEMATTMKLTSGSPVLTEGQDFSTALLTPTGDHIQICTGVATTVTAIMQDRPV